MKQTDDGQDVMEQLSVLAPQPGDAPRAPQQALALLKSRLDERRESPLIALWRNLSMRRHRAAISGLAALLLLVAVLALPPVRAAASDFLGLFRVQKFAAISISPQQMVLLEQVAEQGLYPGEFQSIQDPAPPQEVATLEEAIALAGGPVQSVEALGPPSRIQVSGSGSGRLVVDLQSARRILRAADVDPRLLPNSLEGAEIDATVFPMVEQRWGDDLILMQSPSPQIDYPDDVDPDVIGQALLQMLGMSQAEAERLATRIDWSSTLLLPVPENLATFSEVTVNGNSALALTSLEGGENTLMWQEAGVIYVLIGADSIDALQDIAQSVQ